MRDDGRKGTRRGKGPDMQLVEDVCLEGETTPLLVLPGEAWINHLRGTMDILRLATRGWVRTFDLFIQSVRIQAPRLHLLGVYLVIPCALLLHRNKALSRRPEVYLHGVRKGGPDQEATPAVGAVCRPDGDFRVARDGMSTHWL